MFNKMHLLPCFFLLQDFIPCTLESFEKENFFLWMSRPILILDDCQKVVIEGLESSLGSVYPMGLYYKVEVCLSSFILLSNLVGCILGCFDKEKLHNAIVVTTFDYILQAVL